MSPVSWGVRDKTILGAFEDPLLMLTFILSMQRCIFITMRRIHLLYSKNSYWILWGLLFYPRLYSPAIAHTRSDNWSSDLNQNRWECLLKVVMCTERPAIPWSEPSIQSRALPDTFLAATGITLREKGRKDKNSFCKTRPTFSQVIAEGRFVFQN